MTFDTLLHLLVGLLPVASFLATLVYLDSYKLVKPALVLSVVASGGVMAGACYFVNGWLLGGCFSCWPPAIMLPQKLTKRR